ncbi:hypothetical protein [Pseudomonas pohangensis]|uniref:hypothetical protein n=1 Tax=Pseudomonas pohangensis TaxID=364197 RepID=UPI000B7CB9ED|nr:hypothetical protein [Pseudomonas pohangensis]
MSNQDKDSLDEDSQFMPILSVLAEGGAIRLVGLLHDEKWVFRVRINDMFASPATRETASIDTWQQALTLLDSYPWHCLFPKEVNPGFAQRVWQAYEQRWAQEGGGVEHHRDEWELACGRDKKTKVSRTNIDVQ